MNAAAQKNPHFFTGNYSPLTEEHDIAALEIEGALPPGLSGSLYRVGPNPQFAPRDDSYHWFSGDGMVHAFHIGGGKVSYSNRWARTPKWQLEHEAGRALFGTFGNPATSDPLAQGRNGGTANTSMLWHGGRLFALEESHQPFELDAFTLASKGHQSFGDRVNSRCTAHPKVDPESGELHFFAYSPDGPCSPTMLYGVMNHRCEVTQLQSFTAPHASMAHDFMLTHGHVLFPVTPLTLSVERAMRGKPLSVMMLDIDFFKAINDSYGHDAGDDVLREFAVRIRKSIRGIDLACRYGGEEFVIVMPETDLHIAGRVAERVRRSIACEPFAIEKGAKRIDVTISIGIATLEKKGEPVADVLKRADVALYRAKHDGRNRVVAAAA